MAEFCYKGITLFYEEKGDRNGHVSIFEKPGELQSAILGFILKNSR